MTSSDDAAPIEDADPGLARNRTELAWTRTALSFTALGAAILKARPAAGLALLALSGLIWPLGRLSARPGEASRRNRKVLLITVAVAGASVAALIISLLSAGHALTLPER
ncbi:MAG TPA: DUF202 domain-containing protein [Streptosporangiaceae bacterium]|nr:DUF202 domain-containing protein [Streptosporangiaceae bacterium]